MMCEAASGFYADLAGLPRRSFLAPEAVKTLAKLGFSTDDSHGNFQRQVDMRDEAAIPAVADLMLSALHDVYGARPRSKISVASALSEDLGSTLQATTCLR